LEEDTADVEGLLPLYESNDESDLPPLDVNDEEMLDPLINDVIILPQGDSIALSCIRE
jgi:hypothetical protein